MEYTAREVNLKNGNVCVLRRAKVEDAEELLAAAKAAGYEQAELDVVSTNAPAIALYRKLGFERVGTIPRGMKYQDGSCADLLLMVKPLL